MAAQAEFRENGMCLRRKYCAPCTWYGVAITMRPPNHPVSSPLEKNGALQRPLRLLPSLTLIKWQQHCSTCACCGRRRVANTAPQRVAHFEAWVGPETKEFARLLPPQPSASRLGRARADSPQTSAEYEHESGESWGQAEAGTCRPATASPPRFTCHASHRPDERGEGAWSQQQQQASHPEHSILLPPLLVAAPAQAPKHPL